MQLSFSWNCTYSTFLSHKLAIQIDSSCFFSKIFSCSPNLHDSSSAPWLYMVFTTQYDICFSSYVNDYFKTDILDLHQTPVSLYVLSSDPFLTHSNIWQHRLALKLIIYKLLKFIYSFIYYQWLRTWKHKNAKRETNTY